MCNLSQGVKNEGRREGRIEGRVEGRISAFADMVKNGLLSVEQAAKLTDMTVEQFKTAMSGKPQMM